MVQTYGLTHINLAVRDLGRTLRFYEQLFGLFLSGILPVADGKLAISGRLGENLSVKQGQEAARIASLKALAAAQQHLGTLDRLKKLVKLTVLMATTEQFVDQAPVADGASDLFVQIFGERTNESGNFASWEQAHMLADSAPALNSQLSTGLTLPPFR